MHLPKYITIIACDNIRHNISSNSDIIQENVIDLYSLIEAYLEYLSPNGQNAV